MELTHDEEQAFLAEAHVAVLAVADGDNSPLAVPLWYGYLPGDPVWLVTETDSRKMRLLRRAGRGTLVVETVSPRVRWVSVEVELVDERPVTDAERLELATRYLGAEKARAYVEFAAAEVGPESRVELRVGRWRSADLTPG